MICLLLTLSGEPIQRQVDVFLLEARDRVAADLAAGDLLKLELFDELFDAERIRQVVLVAEHQKRNAGKRRFGHQL